MTEPDRTPDDDGPALVPLNERDAEPAHRRLATYLPNTLIVDDLAITPEGTAVPDEQVDHVHAVAAETGVPVYEMES